MSFHRFRKSLSSSFENSGLNSDSRVDGSLTPSRSRSSAGCAMASVPCSRRRAAVANSSVVNLFSSVLSPESFMGAFLSCYWIFFRSLVSRLRAAFCRHRPSWHRQDLQIGPDKTRTLAAALRYRLRRVCCAQLSHKPPDSFPPPPDARQRGLPL